MLAYFILIFYPHSTNKNICSYGYRCYNIVMIKINHFAKDENGRGYNSKSYAFTLIELLVVIAIIGILAGVVIASLNSARDKGRIAAIKSNLKNFQTQAIMYHADNGTFAGLCTWVAPSTIQTGYHSSVEPMIDALKNIAGDENVRCVVRTSNVPSTSATHFVAADGLQDKNFGVAVWFKGNHYAVDAQSVMTLDSANNGAETNWAEANNRCAAAGKRLPPIEVFKAIYDYSSTDVTQYGFFANGWWSSTPSATESSIAYIQAFNLGNVVRNPAGNYTHVRCAA